MPPGAPTPIPTSVFGATPACSAASSSASISAATTSGGPPVCGVGRRACPITWLSGSATIAWIFVPPRSMPPRSASTSRPGAFPFRGPGATSPAARYPHRPFEASRALLLVRRRRQRLRGLRRLDVVVGPRLVGAVGHAQRPEQRRRADRHDQVGGEREQRLVGVDVEAEEVERVD